MPRTILIAGNWKMNKNYSEAIDLAEGLSKELADGTNGVEVVVCPPFIDLKGVAGVITAEKAPFGLGAQNVYWEKAGAYTGETSRDMLDSVGCTYCIIGHSERRDYFQESDDDVNRKAKCLMEGNITPILCCGESLDVRKAGKHVEHVVSQIKADCADLPLDRGDQLVIAYEPIWAIGTGETATADDAQEVCKAIRDTLRDMFGKVADDVRVLYGGSAKPDNIAGFVACDDVDGALVGGASLKATDFADMVRKSA